MPSTSEPTPQRTRESLGSLDSSGAKSFGIRPAAKEFDDTETILDRLDVNTAGGIRDVLDAIHAIGNPAGASQTFPTPPTPSKG